MNQYLSIAHEVLISIASGACSIRNQFCPNPSCSFFSLKLAGNVVVHSSKHQRMKCKICRKTWVIYRNESRFGLRTNYKKFESAQQMLMQGISVRTVAREIKVSPNTIQRWKGRFSKNHNYFLTQ